MLRSSEYPSNRKRIGGLTGTLAGASSSKGIKNSYASGTITAGEGLTWLADWLVLSKPTVCCKTHIIIATTVSLAVFGFQQAGRYLHREDRSELKSTAFALELDANTESNSSWAKWGLDAEINNAIRSCAESVLARC